ncbi:hypothetical protein H8N01_24645 [Streptomyces sp. AC536]|uniref:hypothetical protein n=1 Tax=Streptomyces buecherae TaxID=2763006 RepID=UPI00164DF23C|nr:hypothetical protein [Streptomyces buecherae]MBC3985676.1 hypothetical protein [Streptomyces buecherae]QNJ40740.1 hypothetical protein H7H31_13510 [Streptomyces buecherae]
MKSIITARMKTAALAGTTTALLLAGAANVSSDGAADDTDNGRQRELALADEAAANLSDTSSEGVRILQGKGRASKRVAASTTKTLATGQRLIVEAVCLGAGSVTITASAGGSSRPRQVRCTESGTGRAKASRFTLITQKTGPVRVAVQPSGKTRGGLAFRVRTQT